MLEILFRGKRLDNCEWVEGASINDRNGALYICPAVSDITSGDNGKRRRIGCWYSVDLLSVGQYTGLTDKNGKRIFDGDIIECWSKGVKVIGTVRQRIDGMWVMYPAWQEGVMLGLCPDSDGNTAVEVIGNIYDNPELLEKERKIEQ